MKFNVVWVEVEKFFAYEHAQILPDIMTSAKALGCGLSVGAFVINQKVASNSLEAGDHGSTYGEILWFVQE